MRTGLENIEGLIFDKDGTLFGFNASWAVWCDRLIGELSEGNDALQAELAAIIGYDKVNRTFIPGSLIVSAAADDTAIALADRLFKFSAEQINEVGNRHLIDLPLVPVTDLNSLLATLQSFGLKLGVATNDSEASANFQLNQCEVSHYFDFICGYDSGFGSKPGAGMLEAFCIETELDASKVAMIGDSLHDLNAGRAAGVGVNIGVLTGPASEADLAGSADIILADISELLDFLPSPLA